MSDNLERCPTCGSTCKVSGTITRFFIPDNDIDFEEIESLKAQLDRYTRIAESGKSYGDDLDNIERIAELEAQFADLLKGPLPNDEMPTDREWTNVEWARNQWWLHMRAAQGFEAQLAECRDKALNGFL